MVKWTTATEINSDYFMIERSVDGVDFQQIGRVKAKGISNNESNYQYVDQTPFSGISYYRLKQVDLDDRYEYFSMVAVKFEGKDQKMFFYPNPIKSGETVKVIIKGDIHEEITLHLTDFAGKILYSQKTFLLDNVQQVELQATFNLSPGIYLITVMGKNLQLREKLLVQ
jgi:hypothetical protein